MEWIIGLIAIMGILLYWNAKITVDEVGESETSEEVAESEASSEYAYVEFDQSFFSGGEKRVRNYVNSYAGKGWRLHSFNVIKLQGLILFQKQRYCLMFENPNKLRGKD